MNNQEAKGATPHQRALRPFSKSQRSQTGLSCRLRSSPTFPGSGRDLGSTSCTHFPVTILFRFLSFLTLHLGPSFACGSSNSSPAGSRHGSFLLNRRRNFTVSTTSTATTENAVQLGLQLLKFGFDLDRFLQLFDR